MTIAIFSLVVFNIFILLSVVVLWLRQIRPQKEDPRLSRGLQLLQSKISVLEDLSDRTETQVKQLTQILDERAKGLQTKMLQAEETLQKIEHSMQRSLNVAEIFQDKIPHEEIIERNMQSKYVLAAKMANEGMSIDEIAAKVDISKSEIEFITKVNKEELSFSPDLLPEWAKITPQMKNDRDAQIVDKVFHTTRPDLSALHRIEDDFKRTVKEVEAQEQREVERIRQLDARADAMKQSAVNLTHSAAHMTQGILSSASELLKSSAEAAKPLVRKVNFPRITVDRSKMPQTIKES